MGRSAMQSLEALVGMTSCSAKGPLAWLTVPKALSVRRPVLSSRKRFLGLLGLRSKIRDPKGLPLEMGAGLHSPHLNTVGRALLLSLVSTRTGSNATMNSLPPVKRADASFHLFLLSACQWQSHSKRRAVTPRKAWAMGSLPALWLPPKRACNQNPVP